MQLHKRVLTVGANGRILRNLSQTLTDNGFIAHWKEFTNINKVLDDHNGKDFDVIAFGRALSEEEKQKVKSAFLQQNAKLKFIEGLAPITNLLVDQVRLACNENVTNQSIILHVINDIMRVQVNYHCNLKVRYYRLNWLYMKTERVLFQGAVEPGAINIDGLKGKGQRFVVVEVNNQVVEVSKI